MLPFLGEFIGTALLIILGDGVVANVVLNKTKGNKGGWIVITFGWAIGVFIAVFVSSHLSKAHLNPAVTVAMALVNNNGFGWKDVPAYLGGQMTGAMTGAFIVWLNYRLHFNATEDADAKLAAFCTGPAIRNSFTNLLTEITGTFVLVFGVLYIATPSSSLGALDALPVALVVLGIGLSLGGTTGYAINPARDLGPRIMHSILPISNKRDSDWSYAWIPVMGPLIGGLLAALVFVTIGVKI
jgi:glycerol uptake facilitator protein